jgi:hypothetical protein
MQQDIIKRGYLMDYLVKQPSHGDRWGNWELDTNLLVLIYRGRQGHNEYEIDLEKIDGSAEMLDWIFQLNSKSWVSRKDMGDLVQAFDDIFTPQSTLCGQGIDKKLDATKYLKTRFNK